MTSRLSRLSPWLAAAVVAVGLTGLLGWIYGIESLKSVYGPITMKANSAIALILCGLSLITIGSRTWPLGAALAALAAGLGFATLSQHLFGLDFGIDQWLFVEAPGAAATASPNRMGPNAAIGFTLSGSALLLLHTGREAAHRAAQTLAFAGIALALVPAVGYLYGAEELYGIARYTGIALHTAVTFLLLHVGVLTARPQSGPMALYASASAAGTLLRRLTPWVVFLPLAIGYVVIQGRQADIFDRGLAHAVFAVSVVVLLLALMWHTAAVIDVTDRERARAQIDADKANRLKDQFIAMLSHELRTPLNVMLGRLRVLESQTLDTEARARAATVVARNGRLLARLVEDLLDLSRASAGQFEIARTPVQLNALVKTVLDGIGPDAALKGVHIRSSLDPAVGTVHVDQERIQQVVFNLLTNAVKFTSGGGTIDVATSGDRDSVRLVVADTGIGFDEQFARHLFEPFRQADASSRREHGGLGLGLSIARHLVELHGGTLTASSPGLGRGAVFTLVLPAAVPQPSGETVAASAPGPTVA